MGVTHSVDCTQDIQKPSEPHRKGRISSKKASVREDSGFDTPPPHTEEGAEQDQPDVTQDEALARSLHQSQQRTRRAAAPRNLAEERARIDVDEQQETSPVAGPSRATNKVPRRSASKDVKSRSNAAQSPSAKGKLKAVVSPLSKSDDDVERFEVNGQAYERQSKRCNQARYAHLPKCTSCISKYAFDLCRFQHLRVIPCRGDVHLNEPRLASQKWRYIEYQYPQRRDLFPSMDQETLQRIRQTTAAALLETMRRERDHAVTTEALWTRPETDIRPQCDHCLTSLFSASLMCRICGRELCTVCADDLQKDLRGIRPPGSGPEKCVWGGQHTFQDLCPLTKFRLQEIEDEAGEMEKWASQFEAARPKGSNSDEGKVIDSDLPSRDFEVDKSLSGPQVDERVGSLTLSRFGNDVSEDTFRCAWRKGEPVLVENCLEPSRFAEAAVKEWGPQSFTEGIYRDEPCHVIRCDTHESQEISVAQFFAALGQSQKEKSETLGEGVWKLKDWPPTAEFNKTFPELYEHFNAALPMPHYTRRDGKANISALFPRNANAPDLGPKMYTAWTSAEDQVSKGSTRLHMDIADAVNIMYFAATPEHPEQLPESRRSGVAAWDIFPAQDANKLREYLKETRNLPAEVGDPIHCQQYFLDTVDRQRLWLQYGVRSWRIYQKQGEAIFIPAGCAHQVCNLTDCMKVAVDFVSPENVERCFQLTSEFRMVNKTMARSWKEDALQLKTMLWHAWRACRTMEGHDYSKLQSSANEGQDDTVKLDQVPPKIMRPEPKKRTVSAIGDQGDVASPASTRASPAKRAKSFVAHAGKKKRNPGLQGRLGEGKSVENGDDGEDDEQWTPRSNARSQRGEPRSAASRKSYNEEASYASIDFGDANEQTASTAAAKDNTAASSTTKRKRRASKDKGSSQTQQRGSSSPSSSAKPASRFAKIAQRLTTKDDVRSALRDGAADVLMAQSAPPRSSQEAGDDQEAGEEEDDDERNHDKHDAFAPVNPREELARLSSTLHLASSRLDAIVKEQRIEAKKSAELDRAARESHKRVADLEKKLVGLADVVNGALEGVHRLRTEMSERGEEDE